MTREGFERFLFLLDAERDAAGRKYEVLRRKLISYFDWRNCPFPPDHADDALTRVIRKIDSGEEPSDPSAYVFGVARMMLLEIHRRGERERLALSQLPASTPTDADSESGDTRMKIDCLRQCLRSLPEKSRKFITAYYEGEGGVKIQRRRELASQLGMGLNALRIRACRLRGKLEECMERCMAS